MNLYRRLFAKFAASLAVMFSAILMTGSVDAKSLTIDPSVVGSWRFAATSHTEITLLTWTINADGTYILTTTSHGNSSDESGQMGMADAHWSLDAASARSDAGDFTQPNPDILDVVGKAGPKIWFRHNAPKPDGTPVAQSGANKFDARLVGIWYAQPGLGDNQSVSCRTIDADGRYQATFLQGGKSTKESGQLTASAGQWTQAIDSGGNNHGIYTVLDRDTVTIRGKFGWTTAWFRATQASPVPLVASMPLADGRVKPSSFVHRRLAPAAAVAPSRQVVSSATPPALPTNPAATPAATPSADAPTSPAPGLLPQARAVPVDNAPAVPWTGAADGNLSGSWSSEVSKGIWAIYNFHDDGTLTEVVDIPQFKAAYPNGIVCKSVIRKASPNYELDMQSTDADRSIDVKAIFSRISQDQFKFEGGDNRPANFSPAATLFTRNAFGGGAKPVGLITSPSLRAQTFMHLGTDDQGLVCIGKDGVLLVETFGPSWFQKPNPPTRYETGDFRKVDGPAGVKSLSGDCPSVLAVDGGWWDLQTPPPATPNAITPDNHVVSMAIGNAMMCWILKGNGTVSMIQGGTPIAKPGKNLDQIIKLCAQYNKSKQLTMLRSDGTVWVDTNNNIGPVTADGPGSAKPINGLDHIKDVSVFSSYPAADTGVALKDDGSILYWGIPFVQDVGQGLAPPTSPEIKKLSKPAKAIRVAAGGNCCGAVDTDGHVWVWGGWAETSAAAKSFHDALRGKDTPGDPSAMDTAAMIDGLENIVDLQIGQRGALALAIDGTLWAWSNTMPPRKILDGVKVPE